MQREERRREEERRQLLELEEARRKRQELDAVRKKKLGSAFALTEDDIEAEEAEGEQRARAARELAKTEERRAKRDRLNAPLASGVFGGDAGSSASSSALVPVGVGQSMDSVTSATTALDIDGSLHEHKYSKVWKDWDAKKRDDPGEIARMFMKVSAIKRRGYGTSKGGRSRSRSRSHRR